MDWRPFRQGGPIRGLINTLMGKNTPLSQQPPYANFYERGQSTQTTFFSDHEPNPFRQHAPPVPLLPDDTVVVQDRANTALQRVPDSVLQQYFNQKMESPMLPPPGLVPAHGVLVPPLFFKEGWRQQHVPSTGRRVEQYAKAPAIPIGKNPTARSNTVVDLNGARAPLVGKAPKVR
jgi:hypothetical protein